MPGDLTRGRDLIVVAGASFVISDPNGDFGQWKAEGYFHDDVRHLSQWRLLVDGRPLLGVASRTVDAYSARTVLVPTADGPDFMLVRDRFVADGMHEDWTISNLGTDELSFRLELRFASDFADVMEAQDPDLRESDGTCTVEPREDGVTLRYEEGGFRCGTRVDFGGPCEVRDGSATFEVALGPRGTWSTGVDVTALRSGYAAPPLLRAGAFHEPEPELPLTLEEWFEQAPSLETEDEDLDATYVQALRDLAALRIRPSEALPHAMPAGGVPWFMCVFGRDSILAAYEALPFQPALAEATLQALARLQARDMDDWRDAEPGKMPHEARRGKLVELGRWPHDPYYGTHDATQLWLILLDEYERWTGDVELVRRLAPAARKALSWIDEHGDLDGDGYLEYRSRSPEGLRNLCWKDSDTSIAFADGRIAEPPIATCEIQGYTYDARLRAARLAREVWGDEELAARQEREAHALRERFNRDFWDEERGTFLLALAGEAPKQRVDSVTSNAGQLLWSGIVDEERAGRVVERLLGEDMFSGWGIRTMSSRDAAFNPLEYHNGTVWPHDTALVAAGLRRYGFEDEAWRVIRALLDAASAFDHSLPELFAGCARDETDVPVRYPEALSPQAWAAGAPLLALRTVLGLEARGGELAYRPLEADGAGPLGLRRLRFRGTRLDVPAARTP